MVCDTTVGAAEPVTFESNRNRPIRIESRSFADPYFSLSGSCIVLVFKSTFLKLCSCAATAELLVLCPGEITIRVNITVYVDLLNWKGG